MTVSLSPVAGGLALYSPYNAGFVMSFKALVPPSGRKWDATTKRWIIATQYGQAVADLCAQFYGVVVQAPTVAAVPALESRLLRIHYIGACKDRGNGEVSAFALVDGQWSVIFPEAALREWFMDAAAPGSVSTLFSVLAIPPAATPEEIKRAYRAAAKRWHPDVNKDPDAPEQFKRVQAAYEALSDPIKRKKYLAGLAFEAAAKQPTPHWSAQPSVSNYRPPLRCGWLMADGYESLGRFAVRKILQWADITNAEGQTLVTSWPAGADQPVEAWI